MNYTLQIRPAWTPVTIILMILGFMIFWPLGLLMLAFILWGDRWQEFRRDFPGGMNREFRFGHGHGRRGNGGRTSYRSDSGNAAFDEYRAQELRRMEEERRRLEEERRDFESYVNNLRRAKDQEEFNRFMTERRAAKRGEQIDL